MQVLSKCSKSKTSLFYRRCWVGYQERCSVEFAWYIMSPLEVGRVKRQHPDTHTHTHTHLFYVQLSSLTNCEQGATKPLAHCFAREITRLHFFIPNCGVWLECCFRETHLHIKSRLTFPSTSLNSSSLRRGCTSFIELNLPSMSIEINKSTQWLSRAGHLPLTQHCAGVFTPFSDACL